MAFDRVWMPWTEKNPRPFALKGRGLKVYLKYYLITNRSVATTLSSART